jgi:hypothetical protein
METTLGKEYQDQDARVRFLKDNCDEVVEKGYTRRFTTEELSQKKTELSEVAIEINEVELEKKHAMQMFKEQLKPLQENMTELLDQIKAKSEFVRDQCFKFLDHENRTVGFYSKEGDLIEERPMYTQELQSTIFSISRTGTES